MKTIAIDNYGNREELVAKELARPEPAADEILIEIKAAAVNPIDWKLREGYLTEKIKLEFPIVLGWDAAGIVSKTGHQVEKFQVGDRVFVRPELTNRGTYAEYTTAKADLAALIPDKIDFQTAAAVPLAGLTAYQALLDVGQLKASEKVLIHAGAGGVGSFAIQIAKNLGAKVATTASSRNIDFLKELGADKVINYQTTDFSKELDDYDLVIDTMGGKIQENSFSVLKRGGRLVSIVQKPDDKKAKSLGIKADLHWLIPDGNELSILAEMMQKKALKPIVGKTFPFSESGLKSAHQLSESHHAKGKIIINITD